jgi:hypothetical protein
VVVGVVRAVPVAVAGVCGVVPVLARAALVGAPELVGVVWVRVAVWPVGAEARGDRVGVLVGRGVAVRPVGSRDALVHARAAAAAAAATARAGPVAVVPLAGPGVRARVGVGRVD